MIVCDCVADSPELAPARVTRRWSSARRTEPGTAPAPPGAVAGRSAGGTAASGRVSRYRVLEWCA